MRQLSLLLTALAAILGGTLLAVIPAADAGAVPARTARRGVGRRQDRPGCRSISARASAAGPHSRKSAHSCQGGSHATNGAGKAGVRTDAKTRAKSRTRTATKTSTRPEAKNVAKTGGGAHPRRDLRPGPAAAAPTTADPSSSPTAIAAQERAATIAAVLAATCQNTELMPTPADLELIRAAVLCLINQKRAQNGEAPLVMSSELAAAAEGHSQELVAADYFAHVSPSGETPVDRIRETGYIPGSEVGYVIGENLAWGTYELATPQAIVSAWIASPGHLANILESQYVETGIGVTPAVPPSLGDGAPGATYAQEFGVILR